MEPPDEHRDEPAAGPYDEDIPGKDDDDLQPVEREPGKDTHTIWSAVPV